MSGYAVFFAYNDGNNVMQLPTNPEQIEITSSQATEKYEILKSGQIVVPSGLELKEFSFECEFPMDRWTDTAPLYVETRNKFHKPQYYLNRFEFWRAKKLPFRFIAGRIKDDCSDTADLYKHPINSLVIIEEMTITEKAGEEGDKYIQFKLMEYRDYGKVSKIDATTGKVKKKSTEKTNPKSTGYYVVKSGDSLWSIAKKYYGDGAKAGKIYSANKSSISNPNLIRVGQKLVIPT